MGLTLRVVALSGEGHVYPPAPPLWRRMAPWTVVPLLAVVVWSARPDPPIPDEPISRWEVPLDQGQLVAHGYRRGVALSPDGSLLAFSNVTVRAAKLLVFRVGLELITQRRTCFEAKEQFGLEVYVPWVPTEISITITLVGKLVHSEDFGSKRYRVVGCPYCGGHYDSSALYCLDCKQNFNSQDLESWAEFLHRLQRACRYQGLGVHPLGQSSLPFDIPQLSSDRRTFLLGERRLSQVTHPDYIRRNILRQSGWSPDLDLSLIAEAFSRALKEVLERERPKKDKQPQYVFRWENQIKKWSIVWQGQKVTVNRCYSGLHLIRQLLSSPGQSILALSLESLCGNSTAEQSINEVTTEIKQLLGDSWGLVSQFGQDDYISTKNIARDLRKFCREWEEELVTCSDQERRMDLLQQRERLNKYVEEGIRPGGKLKTFMSELNRSANKVRRNIKTVLNNLNGPGATGLASSHPTGVN